MKIKEYIDNKINEEVKKRLNEEENEKVEIRKGVINNIESYFRNIGLKIKVPNILIDKWSDPVIIDIDPKDTGPAFPIFKTLKVEYKVGAYSTANQQKILIYLHYMCQHYSGSSGVDLRVVFDEDGNFKEIH